MSLNRFVFFYREETGLNHMWQKVMSGGVYTIAEMSGNHAGKLENALAIVHAAKAAGADCLKIQTYTADTITLDSDNPCFFIHGGTWDGYRLYELYQDAGTPLEWNAIIKQECEKVGIDFLSTPFDNRRWTCWRISVPRSTRSRPRS